MNIFQGLPQPQDVVHAEGNCVMRFNWREFLGVQERDSPLIANCDAIVNYCLYVNTWEGKSFIVILDTPYGINVLQ